ncbi:transcriptional regulator [Asanoa ishikariensis]|uniref:AraC-type DNA-binding protein n=1 Tax=Asanoa ishikariensis TaxID=137265 RepID=A0A1H3PAY1_9ACTN|nr:helix-turn-helix domain-containing protein [Asanoa ishikariensis]GIF67958.1 transcriptional regulator [Asanoa ishikariensis]SDY98286.1 AraC-type DNA-binding protein [Asanoa ishikariensis]
MIGYTVGAPTGALRRTVGPYVGYAEWAAGPLARREVAVSRCVLVLGWGASLDVRDPRGPSGGATGVASFAAGLSDCYVDTVTAPGTASGVQVMLDPLVAARILGRPLGEVANRVVAVDSLDGPGLRDFRALPARLGAAAGWDERFALLDRAFGARLADTPEPDRRLAGAWHSLRRSRGAIPVDALAASVGWSRRHLGAVFRRELGLPPKVLGRLVRFERAYRLAGRAADEGWASVAADAGYYDQAHLIRDFRTFTGSTPARLATSPADSPALLTAAEA